MQLTTAVVSKLSRVPVATLQRWVETSVVVPAVKSNPNAGRSRWNTHTFTPMQAVGLVVAGGLHRSLRSCSPAFIKEVVVAFAVADEKWLTDQFRQGRTHFANVLGRDGDATTPLRPVLTSAENEFDWVDVKAAYEAVTDRMASRV